MKKISIMVILFFTLAGLTIGCSTDFSKGEVSGNEREKISGIEKLCKST